MISGWTDTRSPGFTLVTPGPTASTTPPNSWPSTWVPWAPVKGCGSFGMKIGP